MISTLQSHAKPCASGLYILVDTGSGEPFDTLLKKVEVALAAGCRWIQYRDKSADHKKRYLESQALQDLCTGYASHLIVNDDVSLCMEIDASGVHLGQGDDAIESARQRLGDAKIIGRTCHDSLSLAQAAANDGADYIAFGRFFSSSTKPEAQPAKLEILRKAEQFRLPRVAIGGITLDNAASVINAGADAIAVCHDVMAKPVDEIASHVKRYGALF